MIAELDFRLLGPFEVRSGPKVLISGGGKRRAVLAVLLLAANKVVSIDRLIDALWGDSPPASAVNLVQGYISDLRQLLEPDRSARSAGHRIVSAHGYQLQVAAHESDLGRFDSLIQRATAAKNTGDLASASSLFANALAQWRGNALLDFAREPFAESALVMLDQSWLSAVEAAADVELGLGRAEEALRCVTEPSLSHPERERLTELRMLALYRLGRQAEALTAYESARVALSESLGVDPGPGLRKAHLDVLRHAASLDQPMLRPPHSDALDAGTAAPPLPVALSSFVGRDAEVSMLRRLLTDHRLVTLTGPGGSGKTRLAIEAASIARNAGDREVIFIDLAPVRDPTLIVAVIADACRMRLRPNEAPAPAIAGQLADRRALLVLDNLEHLLDATPFLVTLLAAAPGVAMLATSREPLGIAGEQQLAVKPLPLPPPLADPSTVLSADAVRLFVDRATAADPAFAVAARDIGTLAGICRRLDGLPLALELAAPWTKTLSLRALRERLDHSTELLVGPGRGSNDRHRSLHAAIESSYAALSASERTLLQTLSLFASGATLSALEATAELHEECLPALGGLIDRSLVTVGDDGSARRYRMLETVREYAAHKLNSDTEAAQAARDRHASYFARVCKDVGRTSYTPTGGLSAFVLADEQSEIRAALEHLNGNGSRQAALTMAIDCLPLWWDLGHIEEGYRRLIEQLAGCEDSTPRPLRAAGHIGGAILASAAGDTKATIRLAAIGAQIAADAGEPTLQALGLAVEGEKLVWGAEATSGVLLLQTALDLATRAPDRPSRWGWASRNVVIFTAALSLGEVYRFRDPARARELLTSALTQATLAGDRHGMSFVQRFLGFLAIEAGEYSNAERLLHDSLATARDLGSHRSESRSQEGLAALAWAKADLASATTEAAIALRISSESGHVYNWGRCAGLMADILLEQGDLPGADRILSEAATGIARHDHDFADATLSPRRARAARLGGRPAEVVAELARAATAQQADQLGPARVIYFIETALAISDQERASRIARQLTDRMASLGLVLPKPEQARVDNLLGNY